MISFCKHKNKGLNYIQTHFHTLSHSINQNTKPVDQLHCYNKKAAVVTNCNTTMQTITLQLGKLVALLLLLPPLPLSPEESLSSPSSSSLPPEPA